MAAYRRAYRTPPRYRNQSELCPARGPDATLLDVTDTALTRDDLTDAIVRVTSASRTDVEDSTDLLALGLDSLGVMRQVNELRVHGLPVTYQDLLGEPTLDGWWTRIAALLRANPHLAA